MFSIIIPLYNKSAYIEKCLQSILNQTFQVFEVIVVNDGSTDEGPSKVMRIIEENMSHQYIPLNPEYSNVNACSEIKIINQTNSGVSIARNNGVWAAKFNFIAFLDADDWWEPTYLEEMKSLAEDYPESGIYGSSYYLVKNGKKHKATIGVNPNYIKGIINYCQVYAKTLCMPLWTGATVIRKSIFESEKGFKRELLLGEDFDLWIRVALKYPVAFLNKPLANYNQDVELINRAVGNLQLPANHMLWNLEHLIDTERTNSDLKQLLDNIRVYSLLPYYLTKDYRELARKELNKVNWAKQPASAKRRYNSPIPMLKAWYVLKTVGASIKQRIILSWIN